MTWKDLLVPFSNKTKVVRAVQLWEVRWQSRHGEYCSNVRPEMEAFDSEEKAKDFQGSLQNAFALIRHTSGNKVKLSKAA